MHIYGNAILWKQSFLLKYFEKTTRWVHNNSNTQTIGKFENEMFECKRPGHTSRPPAYQNIDRHKIEVENFKVESLCAKLTFLLEMLPVASVIGGFE